MAPLTDFKADNEHKKIARNRLPFRIVFSETLDNRYEIKNLSQTGQRDFHSFVCKTVYKGLSVSEVDWRYRRQDDKNANDEKDGLYLIHYGEDNKSFRIFGYYNHDGYFVVKRLDSKHSTHKKG